MRRVFYTLALATIAVACSDDGPTGPTSTVTLNQVNPVAPAGTVLSIRSGETGLPVAEAEIVVAGQSHLVDDEGQVVLKGSFASGSPIDVLGQAFLDRRTVLRAASETTFELWPRSSPTGLTEDFTFEVVYTSAVSGEPRSMMRIFPEVREVYVVPNERIGRDPRAMRVVATAAASIGEITGGAIEFIVAEGSTPAGAVVIDLIIDPEDTAANDAVALARRRMRGRSIVGGTVIYESIETARSSTTLHELGHSSGSRDVMNTRRNRSQVDRFSTREALVMSLMLKRPSGNEMPDSDRGVSGQSLETGGSAWASVVACRD